MTLSKTKEKEVQTELVGNKLEHFLNDYAEIMEKRTKDCQEIINCEDFTSEEKQPYQEEKQEYKAKIEQVQKINN